MKLKLNLISAFNETNKVISLCKMDFILFLCFLAPRCVTDCQTPTTQSAICKGMTVIRASERERDAKMAACKCQHADVLCRAATLKFSAVDTGN